MVIIPLVINIFLSNLHHCTQYRQSYLCYNISKVPFLRAGHIYMAYPGHPYYVINF